MTIPPLDQSSTSSSSLAIAAPISTSVKTPARNIDMQYSEASITLGSSDALSPEMVCTDKEKIYQSTTSKKK